MNLLWTVPTCLTLLAGGLSFYEAQAPTMIVSLESIADTPVSPAWDLTSIGPTGDSQASVVVTVYSAPWCVVCPQLTRWLNDRRIPHREVIAHGMSPLPQLQIGSRRLIGFDPAAIEAALK